ncbi:MAG: DUF6514 family protein [Firmicutes bacterium]|nr:DUF6514 family protein [Bacillota bacterium]
MGEEKIRYVVTKERFSGPDIGVYDTYGITCQAAGQMIRIRDISTDAKKVTRMEKKFNRFGLAPIHFYDVVEDMLA